MKQLDSKKEWYQEWFDSPYYSILYQNRDTTEAQAFVGHLINKLNIVEGATILDVACGRGRHAIELAQRGFQVTGIDLSIESITFASQFENEQLSFFTHDMRRLFRINYFDFIFNFFTSFGYFEKREDHLVSLQSIRKGLKKEGLFVLDFLNAHKVRRELKPFEVKKIDGIEFIINRKIVREYVFKTIEIKDGNKNYQVTERVRLFDSGAFEALFSEAQLQIKAIYGDYQLGHFDPMKSPRLILFAQKQ